MKRTVHHIVQTSMLLLSLLMMACDGKTDKQSYRIGVSQCSGGFWRQKQNNEMHRELLLHEGVTMELLCAEDNDEKQIADIQRLIEQKVDMLIVSPHDTLALSPIISKAYASGIPVLLFDRVINNDKYTAFVGGDNQRVGMLMAAYVATQLHVKGGKVLEIMGNMQTSPASLRHEGFMKGLANADHIEVVASVDAGWLGPRASKATDSLLRLHPDINVIVAHSDYMAGEAKKVADKLYPNNNYIFVGADGFGAPGLGVEAVEKGILNATAIYPTGGDIIIQTALKILRGEKFERQTLLQSNLVSTPQEATLLINMERTLTAEVERVERMHHRAVFYLKESQRERLMLYATLGVLGIIGILCAALYRVNLLRRKSNKRLHEQQNTLKEQNERLLSMTTQLEEAMNAKLVFFTNISHDFRTPLNLIAAPIDEAIKITEGENKGGIMKLLLIAQRNVGVLLDLVNQILDFRKVENGKMELNPQTVDINLLIHAWHESFSSLAQKKGLELHFGEMSGECNVNVDVKKLERMVYNLLGNSIKFTPSGGKIYLQYTKTSHHLSITVRDTGPGIDQENLNRIFERFYQLDNSNQEGSGIGLALVKKYAELMGGRVEIESNIDNQTTGATGTSITITIPSAPNDTITSNSYIKRQLSPESLLACSNLPSTELDSEQHITADETNPVALVIDDNADMRSFISTLLCDKYRVLTACDGKEGLQLAKTNVPDIVICDVMMPVMDGLECCQKMKNDECTSHIPIIMLTACSLDEQRVKGLQSGAEAYLAKPFNSSVLLAQIDTLLKNRVHVNIYQAHAEKEKPETPHIEQDAAPTKAGPTLSRFDRAFIEKMYGHIEKNYSDEEFCVEILADKMCLSRTQLYRKCKALTGDTPVELIRNARLEHAREILLNGYDQIANVASAVGIPNAAYFSKCYKTYFGEYPKDTVESSK